MRSASEPSRRSVDGDAVVLSANCERRFVNGVDSTAMAEDE
jgi:hypothetical protein